MHSLQFEKLEDGTPGKCRVYSKMQDSGEEVVDEFNTVSPSSLFPVLGLTND